MTGATGDTVTAVAGASMRTVVVLPTYNEALNIEPFLRRVRDEARDADVLVVDDNSPDGTGDIAQRVADELGRISVLRRPVKDGLGSAYRAGFAHVLDLDYDVVVSMDSDFSHDPAVIDAMRAVLADGADVVVGSRYVPGGGVADWPVRRQLLSRWGNRYTRTVLGIAPRDCTSGFRAYRSDALRQIKPESTTAEGYAFLTELVRRADRAGLRVAETPIIFCDRTRGSSKMSARIIVESMLLVTRWAVTDRLNLKGRLGRRR